MKSLSPKSPFPLVSVFLAVYQQKDYIREAVTSVLQQDYPNMEIVLGDDGSTDGTQEILKEYRDKHPDIIKLVLVEQNTGITANCNRIFKECTGKYIAFQAGDDVWLPGKIRTQVDYMEAHPECAICYHNLEIFDSATGKTIRHFNGKKGGYPYEGHVDVSIRHGCFNGAVSNMVRRSECPSGGFDSRTPRASDWLFWIETLMGGGEIHYIDLVLGKYRRHQNNATNPKNIIHNYIDHLNILNILLIAYPVYHEEIMSRKSDIFKILAKIDKDNREVYLNLSNKYGVKNKSPNLSGLISFLGKIFK